MLSLVRSVRAYISSINNNDASCRVRVAYVSKYRVFTGKEVNAMLRETQWADAVPQKQRQKFLFYRAPLHY